MALKMLINVTGSLVACMKSLTHGKEAARFTLAIPAVAWARFYTLSRKEAKVPVENLNLVFSLEQMGVDMTRIRRRNAVILKRKITYERKLKHFLTEKGADANMVASIISRYPQAITRNSEVLDEMWNIWKGILETDETILSVVQRSPESFFRTSNTENLSKNIIYLQSLGLQPKVLSQLMVKSPRTFSNSIDLNKQIVEYLLELCTRLGGENPQEFVRELISRNIFILTKSINRIQANIENMRSLMKLDDAALLLWIQEDGAPLLSLSYSYFENNYINAQKMLQSLGCTESEISQYIYMCPKVMLMTPQIFASKIDLLLECGIDVKEILNTPNILTVNINSLKSRIKALKDCDFDFRSSGLRVLVVSQAKFTFKLERLHKSMSLDESAGES